MTSFSRDALRERLRGHTRSSVLVVSDLDGTLIHGSTLHERVEESLTRLRESGVELMIATGRGLEGARRICQRIAARTPEPFYAACSDGAIIARWSGGVTTDMSDDRFHTDGSGVEVVHAHTYDPAPVLDALAGHTLEYAVQGVAGPFYTPEPVPYRMVDDGFVTVPEHVLRTIPVSKVVVRHHGGYATESDLRSSAEWHEVYGAMGESVHPIPVAPEWVDVVAAGVSKGAAVREVRRPDTFVIAIGDSLNDLPLFEEADFSVAMGNAVPEVHAVADAVVPSWMDDGAATLFDAIVEELA